MSETASLLNKDSNIASNTIDRIGFGKYQIIMTSTFIVLMLSQGRDNTISSLVVYILQKEWDLSSLQVGVLSGASLLGMTIGFILSLIIEQKKGRILSLRLSIIIMIIFELALSLMVQFWGFAIIRVITGIGNGLYLATVISVASESTPTAYRGKVILYVLIAGFVGFIFSLVMVIIFVPDLQSGGNWRAVIYIPVLIQIPFVFILFKYVVESPLILAKKGSKQEAIKNLNFIAKMNKQPELTQEEKQLIDDMPQFKIETIFKQILRFFNRENRLKTVQTVSAFSLKLFSYFGMVFVIPYMLQEQGAQEKNIIYYYLGLAVSTFTFFMISTMLIEIPWIGRRRLFIGYEGIMLGIMIANVFVKNPYVIGFVVVVAASISAAQMGILSVMIVELFDTKLRSTSVIFANLWARTISSVALYLLLIFLDIGIWLLFVFFVCVSMVVFVAVYSVNRETRGIVLDT